MSRTAFKLMGFLATLALVFGAAVAAGSGFGPLRDDDRAASADGGMDEHGGMGEGEHGAAQPLRGLAVSEGGLTLRLSGRSFAAGATAPLRFRIVDADGVTVRDFDLEHTRRLHLIVVRRDLSGFQHLHPRQLADGSWSTPLELAEPGTYRVFADFSHDGSARTLASDLQADGQVHSRPLPPVAPVATVDGLEVRLVGATSRAGEESELSFTVSRDGRPVALADYLGAKGHLVALREGDLAFLHVHPDADRLRFMATFPSAGRYRLFLQFRSGGAVHTAAFTHEVAG
ncbi:MAG: hypothetical protein JST31_02205 [Actinobacteria bacterium]|nr:hypothetical protein [Actinomycetota bacterium]